MKVKSIIAALLLMVASMHTVWAQKQGSLTEDKAKVVLYVAGNKAYECNISQLDSIIFVNEKPVIDDIHEWVDLDLPSGTLWATCNVGANSPEEYGDYFAWGEIEPKSDYSWNTYKYCKGYGSNCKMTKYCTSRYDGYDNFIDYKKELESMDDAATTNWGDDWQMPNDEQFKELANNFYTTMVWTTQNDVEGYMITSNSNGMAIFLPAAGYYIGTNFFDEKRYGYYWTRTLANVSDSGSHLIFHQGDLRMSSQMRYIGYLVRPVRKK